MTLPDKFARSIRFRRDLKQFQQQSSWRIEADPKLEDFDDNAARLGEYFWQDLWVAKKIFEWNPQRHFDVGSRIDGFVAHIACRREVEVFDIRPMPFRIPGVKFRQIDISDLPADFHEKSDCVTCLHSIEHFGLGRYGDKVDDMGWQKGIKNLAKMLRPGGRLICSTPVGIERVKFNAHRIFHPSTIHDYCASMGLGLESFAYLSIRKEGPWAVTESLDFERDYKLLGEQKYSLGIFILNK